MSYEKQNFTSGMLLTADHLNHIEDGIANKIVALQSDWNQNDETAADYVKNRTHWLETTTETIVEDFSEDYSSDSPENYAYYTRLYDDTNSISVTYFNIGYTAGKKYKVVFDGVEYFCESKSNDYGISLGNTSLVTTMNQPDGWVDYGDTGEPFAIFNVSYSTIYVSIYTSTGGIHTLSIYAIEEAPHPLDQKYIPSTVPVIQSATVGQTVVVKAVDENGVPTEWEAVDAGGDGTVYREFTNYNGVVGRPVKMSGHNIVADCYSGDDIMGVVVERTANKAKVQIGGFVTLPYTDGLPALGFVKLGADGNGGVRYAASSTSTYREHLVVSCDSNAKTVTFRL